jgi:hypothetical protein
MTAPDTIDLPFGDAFGPGQLEVDDDELTAVLEIVSTHEGNPRQFDHAVAERFFEGSPDPLTRAENVRFALQTENGYGIVDGEFNLTDLGRELYRVRDDEAALYDRFSTHILQHLHGREVLETIRDLEALGQSTTEANIRRHLRDHFDIHLGEGANHWSQMRAWLAKAGIVNTGVHIYDIDEDKVAELTGVISEELVNLEKLSPQQLAFLWTLAIINPEGTIENSHVRRAAEAGFDVEIDQTNISRRVLDPLADRGFIEWEHRDGAPNTVKTTEKFDSSVLEPALKTVSRRVGVPSTALRTSFAELEAELAGTESEYSPTEITEILTVKVGSLIDLDFIGWLPRSEGTAAAVFDRVRTSLERWMITSVPFDVPVHPEHIYQSVGQGEPLRVTTILLLTRQGATQKARRVASQLMQGSTVTILIVSVDDLAVIENSPDRFRNDIELEVERANRVKRIADRETVSLDDQQRIELSSQSVVKAAFEEDGSGSPGSTGSRSLDEFSEKT